MRFTEAALANSTPPMHVQLLDNNQTQRSGPGLSPAEDPRQQFFVGLDSGTYSSLAVTRGGGGRRRTPGRSWASSSCESLADYDCEAEEAAAEASGSDWSEYSEDANLPPGCRGIVNPNYPGFQHLGPSLLSDTDDATDDERELQDEVAPLHSDLFNNNGAADNISNNNNNNGNELQARPADAGNNNELALNRLDAQRKQQLYDKPKFNIQTASTLMECMSYVKGVHDTLASRIGDEDVQIVQLGTGVRESLQFARLERIALEPATRDELDGLTEEPLDLIREASALKLRNDNAEVGFERSGSINNVNNNNADNNNINNNVVNNNNNNNNNVINNINSARSNKRDGSKCPGISTNPFLNNPFLGPLALAPAQPGKMLEGIDLLADCPQLHHAGGERQPQQQQSPPQQPDQVPDLVTVKREHCQPPDSPPPTRQRGSGAGGKPCAEPDLVESFDVYNIETAMPHIDMDAIEMHLKAARVEERRRRNDREEIRRRLAMGPEAEEQRGRARPGQRQPRCRAAARASAGLQICFVNDVGAAAAASESSASSSACSSLAGSPRRPKPDEPQLQTEARLALAQAKQMARMQMELERQRLKVSPIAQMVRASLQKIGLTLGEERRRLTRALLTELNIAQLQVLANDLHARIATLNEALVGGLLARDDLHMEQDSMLVDVEDLTRYLHAKQQSPDDRREQQQQQQQQQPAAQAASRTVALLRAASQAKLASQGRQLVASLVRK